MAEALTNKELEAGEYLCFQGEESKEIYILRSGKLQVIYVEGDGIIPRERVEEEGMIVGTVSEVNTTLGELGALLKDPRSASIRAAEKSVVSIIDLQKRGFEETIASNPKIGMAIAKTIAERLELTSRVLVETDRVTLEFKSLLDKYTVEFFMAISDFERKAKRLNLQEMVNFLKEFKESLTYQIGRVAEVYKELPLEIYTILLLPFMLHGMNFSNRVFSQKDEHVVEGSGTSSGEQKGKLMIFHPGDIVCKEGQIDENLYILVDGKLEILVGVRSIGTIQGRGAIFGEMALFGGTKKRSSTVKALTEVQAIPIPSKGIEVLLQQKPQTLLHIIKIFAKRLPSVNEGLLRTLQQLNLLLSLFEKSEFGLVSSYYKLSNSLNAKRENLSEMADEIDRVNVLFNEIKTKAEEAKIKATNIFSSVGYKRERAIKMREKKFEGENKFVSTLSELPSLMSEHINFVVNCKKGLLKATNIETPFDFLMEGISVEDKTELITGRLHNYGEKSPFSFLSFFISEGKSLDKESLSEVAKFFSTELHQEIYMTFSNGGVKNIFLFKDLIEEEAQEETAIYDFIEKYKKNPEDRDVVNKMHSALWDLLIGITKRTLAKGDGFSFEKDDIPVLNFGLIDENLLPEPDKILTMIEDDKKYVESPDFKIYYLDEYLRKVYKDAFGFTKLEDLNKQLQELEKNYSALKGELEELIKGKDNITINFPEGEKVREISHRIDELKKPSLIIDRDMAAGKSFTGDERTRVLGIKNEIDKMKKALDTYMANFRGKVPEEYLRTFRLAFEKQDEIVRRIIKAEEDIEKKKGEIKICQEEIKSVTQKQKENKFKDELIRLKRMMQLCAKRGKVEFSSVLVGVRDIATKVKLFETLKKFETIDPLIYENSRVRKQGKPEFILIPGSGYAIYDWERNMIIYPVAVSKNLEEQLANAYVEYRWDVDEERLLRDSYGDLKPYKGLSFMKLKDALVKDYIIFATKESKGWKVLDKEVREWFLWKIAPKQKSQQVN